MIVPKRWEAFKVNFVFFMIGALPVARKLTRTFRPTGMPRIDVEVGAACVAAPGVATVGVGVGAAA